MANDIRRKRVGDQIQRVIATLLMNGTIYNVPVLTNCTAVEMNRDLSYARCMFSIPGSAQDKATVLKRLDKLKGFIRHAIVTEIKLRQAPDLRFYLDDSLERGLYIDAKIRELQAVRASVSADAEANDTEASNTEQADIEVANTDTSNTEPTEY